MNNQCFADREQLTDLLNSQKFLTERYNSSLNEAATPEFRATLTSILAEEQQIQNRIFNEMNERGFYNVCKAEEQKIQKTKDQYAPKCTCVK